ncbi:restriction endonuclease subunit S [Bacteroides fragilis]|uniref:restriction endonuclease subunit S n=1 Tax=Bacteroides sp. TaxID=29523 RepID=UPI002A75FD18|nr:restriction endonuclease subunit S [Bacteroides sp.]MCE8568757.1 restriction endonuclease subunit S [Bacteroides fragilis]MDY3137738.1 restriction endonuclease subunit S [Bacteroides sp.]
MADNKNNNERNVPHLRFPEFSGEWKKCKFGDIATGFDYGMNAAAKPFDGENKYIRITDIDEASSTYNDKDIVSPDGRLTDNYVVNDRDILLVRTGASTGKSYLYRKSDGKLYYAGFLIRANITEHNPYFVFSQLHTHRYWRWVSIMSARSGQPGINSQEYSSFPIFTTSLHEENKISTLLSLLNERIVTQNKIIEDLKKLKSAIVDKLYSSAKGETYSFRQLFEVVNEKNKKLIYSNVLSASQELGMIERSDINIDIKFEQNSISEYKIVRKGDYVVHLRSFQGGFAFSDRTGICSPAYTILHPNDLVAYGYLSHFFISKPFIKSLKLVTYGIRDGRSINVDEWLDMTVTLPTKREQSHILAIINAIDNKLHNENQIHNYMFRQRTYLLKTMFI